MEDALKYHGILRRMDESEKLQIIRSLVKDSVEERENIGLLFELLGDPNYDFRKAAFEELEKFGGEILTEVVELLKSGTQDQKYWCTRLLCEMGEQAAIGLELALSEDDEVIRKLAIRRLGELKPKTSVNVLMSMFADSRWSLRFEAFQALRQYGSAIFQELVKKLDSENEDYIYWCVRLLGTMGQRSRKVLMDLLQTKDPEMKFVVASALGETGDVRILEMLVKMFEDQSWLYCQRASDSLIRVGAPAVSVILKEMTRLEAKSVYWHVRTLCKIGFEAQQELGAWLEKKAESYLWDLREIFNKLGMDALCLLKVLAESSKKRVRFYAYQLCSDMQEQDIADILIGGLSDSFWPTRKLCAETMIQLGESVVAQMRTSMGNLDLETLYWYVFVLKHSKKGCSLLIEMLNSENKAQVTMVAEALRGRVTPEAVTPLLNCLRSKVWTVRREAAETLLESGVDGLEKIIASLMHQDAEYTFWLTWILRKYPKSVFPHISALLYKENFPVELAAAAMGIIRSDYFVPALKDALTEKNPRLVLYATWALSEIHQDEEIRSIWGLLSQLNFKEEPYALKVVTRYREQANSYLISGMKSANSKSVINSIWLCGKLGIVEALPVLVKFVHQGREEYALEAVDALMRLHCPEIVPELKKALEHSESTSLRLKILSVLGTLGEESVIPLILNILNNASSVAERNSFSKEIFRMGPGVIGQLVVCLSLEEVALRTVAAELLLEFGGLAVPRLKKELESTDKNRRYWASKILKSYSSEVEQRS
jgi:HEAT repeat protein